MRGDLYSVILTRRIRARRRTCSQALKSASVYEHIKLLTFALANAT